ncbi:MAG: cytochrome d ubiquinol oxidase subunit [Actinomycetota bacterium]|jgi:cytochrome d ubiquinol oxidase subunit II
MEPSVLQIVWIVLIAVLWIGYFVLEGFDFGVGMLLRVLGKNEAEKRTVLTTLGPLWDGNEVWLLVAGGATFAAFPEWYATLFSGFYLPLFLILVGLIVRGVAFEYRSKYGDATWRGRWDLAIVVGSFIPSLLWGVAFANLVRGVEIEKLPEAGYVYTGGFFALLNPFSLLGGLVTLTLFLTHGAIFISLKTDGELRHRARALSIKLGLVAAVLAVAFLLWAQLAYSDKVISWIPVLLAAVSWVAAIFAGTKGREGWAFSLSAGTLAMAVTSLFTILYPNVMPNIDRTLAGLNIVNASSTEGTLKIMTIVAVVMTPIVLAYQGWTYWVFRKRLTAEMIVDPLKGSLDDVKSL